MGESSPAPEFIETGGPPFPENVPLARLETVSLSGLMNRDAEEQKRLLQACKDRGFFYLELGGTEHGETILLGASEAVRKVEPLFHWPLEDKMEYSFDGKTTGGYKKIGISKVDDKGGLDKIENFNILRRDMCSEGPMSRTWPKLILRHKAFFAEYSLACQAIGILILEILAEQSEISLELIRSCHALDRPSGDHIRVVRIPPQPETALDAPDVCFPAHTDFGSVTILMNWLGGLQLYSESARSASVDTWSEGAVSGTTGEWQWAKPKPGCAIVNLGDAAVCFFDGVMCSGRHRVVPPPGEQAGLSRYSCAYFLRPGNDVVMKSLKGQDKETGPSEGQLTASQWVEARSNKVRLDLQVKT